MVSLGLFNSLILQRWAGTLFSKEATDPGVTSCSTLQAFPLQTPPFPSWGISFSPHTSEPPCLGLWTHIVHLCSTPHPAFPRITPPLGALIPRWRTQFLLVPRGKWCLGTVLGGEPLRNQEHQNVQRSPRSSITILSFNDPTNNFLNPTVYQACF